MLGVRRAPPGARSPPRPARPRPVYLAGASGRPQRGPGPQARPSRRAAARVGEGWVPPQRGAWRLRRAAGGGQGEGRPRGGGGLTCATAIRCASRGRGERAEGGRGCGGTGATLGMGLGQWCRGDREQAAGQVPGDLAGGRPSHPREENEERALIGTEEPIRKQVARGGRQPPARVQRKESRRPSPPEETPPQPGAATAGRAGLKGCGAGTVRALSKD